MSVLRVRVCAARTFRFMVPTCTYYAVWHTALSRSSICDRRQLVQQHFGDAEQNSYGCWTFTQLKVWHVILEKLQFSFETISTRSDVKLLESSENVQYCRAMCYWLEGARIDDFYSRKHAIHMLCGANIWNVNTKWEFNGSWVRPKHLVRYFLYLARYKLFTTHKGLQNSLSQNNCARTLSPT